MGAGGYDWLAVWRRMYDEERAQAEAATEPGFERLSDHWAGQAGRFASAAARAPQPDSFLSFLLPRLRPTDTVIDVGAGTGRYVPLLAQTVRQVVAVEPSASMGEHLVRTVDSGPYNNVAVVAASWPGAAVPPADVVISAHVLYSLREIGPFLQALDAAAGRACYLYLALRHPTSFLSPFWERLRGEPRLPLPCALEALNALHQLAIPANMQLVPVTTMYTFADRDEALADIRHRLRFVPDAERDERILAAIDDLLLRREDGSLAPQGLATQAAVLYWER